MCKVTPLLDVTYRKICSFHFEPECFEETKKKRLLKPYAVPTIFVERFMRKELFYHGILEGMHFCSPNYYLLMLSEINSVFIPWI